MVEAVVCSSAIPVAFPVQSFMGSHFVDGGILTNMDIFSAVEKCAAAGFAEEDIIIDAIMASDRTI
jgi:predicted acylesterase/phospholipase RssA